MGSHLTTNNENILAILSLIFWAMTITVTIKYVILMMRADNKGEGGSLALMALASRFSQQSKIAMWLIPILGIFAAALFYGDSVITPAISVLSAIEGLQVVAPSLSHYILPITLLILAFLFAFQKMGTTSVGILFGPIMCVWFMVLAVLGLVHIFEHPVVLQAINPLHAVSFLTHDPKLAFLTLGSVVLAMTGAEALYADMGHFGRPPSVLRDMAVFPNLMLNYLGQGAFIMDKPEGIENPLFLMGPEWMLWPLLILATLATIIASQAVISGAFSVTQQAIQLGYLPRMSITHTSGHQMGQIYIPFINWMLFFVIFLSSLSNHPASLPMPME